MKALLIFELQKYIVNVYELCNPFELTVQKTKKIKNKER